MIRFILLLTHFLVAIAACRNRFLWPFDSKTSIWNVPIGSDAAFKAARIYHEMDIERGCLLRKNGPGFRIACGEASSEQECLAKSCCWDDTEHARHRTAPKCFRPAGGPPISIHNDQDLLAWAKATDPITPWIDVGEWKAGNQCARVGPIADHLPVPEDWLTGPTENNNSAGLLMPDNVTLIQFQPFYRCKPKDPIRARYHRGSPTAFPWTVSILGDGNLGAHGGSGLSSVGGTIRAGELLPSTGPIRHALKLEFLAHDYYFAGWPKPSFSACHRWPATGCDSDYFNGTTDLAYHGDNPELGPGSLLAVPSSAASHIRLQTVPGKKILHALRDYGGYIVDDTAGNSAAICMERSVSFELKKQFNISVFIQNPLTEGPFFEDLVSIFQNLHVVTDNTKSTIGGKGKRLAPYAPSICM